MKFSFVRACLFSIALGLPITTVVHSQEWPQWRGAGGNAKIEGFETPATWPEQLTQVWRIEVGDGVATPALVGNRLYVFTRVEGNEVIKCISADDGKTLWQDSYSTSAVRGPASSYGGPRSSPAVGQGKVVTLGVQSVLTCYDAESGNKLWQNKEFEGEVPTFYPSSSPLIIENRCIAQLGGNENGGIIAFDLNSGETKWRWEDDGPAYASPILMSLGEMPAIVAVTNSQLVVLDSQNGNELLAMEYQQGRYNAATPIIEGSMMIVAGPNRGATGYLVSTTADGVRSEEAWHNSETSVLYNTPVLKDGYLFGISVQNELFCINLDGGNTVWTASLASDSGERAAGGDRTPPQRDADRGEQRGNRRRGGRRGGGGGYGSVVDAGEVLFALTPAGNLIVVKPNPEAFEKIAQYRVAEGGTYAYPIIQSNSIYIKDSSGLTKWQIQ